MATWVKWSALALAGLSLHAAADELPTPVDSLDIGAYLGRWYQMYASATVKYTQELGGNCVIADYASVEGRKDEITVENTVYPLGRKVSVSGYAVADPTR